MCVTGRVKKRTAPNDKVPTGMVEVAADKVTVLNTVAKSLPFSISGAPEGDDDELREEVRLKNRVLDLRRPQMVRNLRLRAKTIRALRKVLEDTHDFLEVETPILTRSTPRELVITSSLRGSSPARASRCLNRRSCSSRCSWWRVRIGTIRWRGASGTRT